MMGSLQNQIIDMLTAQLKTANESNVHLQREVEGAMKQASSSARSMQETGEQSEPSYEGVAKL